MERIEIEKEDIHIYGAQQINIYYYSDDIKKEYQEVMNEIVEQLCDFFNSDDLFTSLYNKMINDRKAKDESLEKLKLYLLLKLCDCDAETISELINSKGLDGIKNIEVLKRTSKYLDDANNKNYLNILFKICSESLEDKIRNTLESYVISKEPALTDVSGVSDYEQCDFIIDQYHRFLELSHKDAIPDPPTINSDGSIVINKGDIFHGTRYSEQVLDSIATKGLESGQLHGVHEDGETYFCIDFFKATKDSTPDEICCSDSRTNSSSSVVFVIKNSNLEGANAICPELTDYDAYDETTEKGRIAREYVNVDGLPLTHSSGASFLMGVPPCMISSIIINPDIENDPKKVEFLSSHFPKTFIVSRTSGKVLIDPRDKDKEL